MINDNEWAFKDSDEYHFSFANDSFQHPDNSQIHSLNIPEKKIVPVTNMQGPSHIWELKVAQVSSVKSWDELFRFYAMCHVLL